MSKLKARIIMVGICLSVLSGAFLLGKYGGGDVNSLEQSQVNQYIAQQRMGSLASDRITQMLEVKQQIVVAEEVGIANVVVHSEADKWNSWLTGVDTEISVEYKALISIDTGDITIVDSKDGGVVVAYSDSSINVTSLEIVNENIITNRAIFGTPLSDDEKIVIRKEMIEQTKDKIINDKQVIDKSKESIADFFYTLGEELNVDIEIVG